MRVDFVKAIDRELAENSRAVLLTGDLGFNAFENIATRYGKRFLNAGVAEQNMIGLSAGMALSGLKPWVYSIVPFVAFRALEQIRNDLCLHSFPVNIVGNGGGYTYGIMGSTHHALEDLGVLKTLPNLSLFFPCANDQVQSAVQAMSKLEGPGYLRLAVSPHNTQAEPMNENPATLTRQYTDGAEVTVVGVGHAVQLALAALKNGELDPKQAAVFGLARFPFQLERETQLLQSLERTRRVLVLEEHYAQGSIAESLRLALPAIEKFELMAPTYSKNQRYGSPAFHLQQCGITPASVATKAAEMTR